MPLTNSQGCSRGGCGGRGRGGRGSGRGRGRVEIHKAAPVEMKFHPHGHGGKVPSATYATVLDQICNYVQGSYKYGKDIATSLREGKAVDLATEAPKLTKSSNADKTLKAEEDEQYRMIFKAEIAA